MDLVFTRSVVDSKMSKSHHKMFWGSVWNVWSTVVIWLLQQMEKCSVYKTPSRSVLKLSSSAPLWPFLMTRCPQITSQCDSQRKEAANEEITSDLNARRDGCARRCSEPNPGWEADKRRVLGEIRTRVVGGASPSWWCHPVSKRIYSSSGRLPWHHGGQWMDGSAESSTFALYRHSSPSCPSSISICIFSTSST